MIPKYPFRIEVTRKLGAKFLVENFNFETLGVARSKAVTASTQPGFVRVRMLLCLEEINHGFVPNNEHQE